MGYVVYSDLVKIRRTAHYKDIEICLDEVSPLGSFIELEKICKEDVDGMVVESEFTDILETLNIDTSEKITRGYDELMNDYLAGIGANNG